MTRIVLLSPAAMLAQARSMNRADAVASRAAGAFAPFGGAPAAVCVLPFRLLTPPPAARVASAGYSWTPASGSLVTSPYPPDPLGASLRRWVTAG
jgi:hypothetical protein